MYLTQQLVGSNTRWPSVSISRDREGLKWGQLRNKSSSNVNISSNVVFRARLEPRTTGCLENSVQLSPCIDRYLIITSMLPSRARLSIPLQSLECKSLKEYIKNNGQLIRLVSNSRGRNGIPPLCSATE